MNPRNLRNTSRFLAATHSTIPSSYPSNQPTRSHYARIPWALQSTTFTRLTTHSNRTLTAAELQLLYADTYCRAALWVKSDALLGFQRGFPADAFTHTTTFVRGLRLTDISALAAVQGVPNEAASFHAGALWAIDFIRGVVPRAVSEEGFVGVLDSLEVQLHKCFVAACVGAQWL
ncbi:hypothetical protein BDV95DRAFT_599059 [Massariosphaeria phaeospora]|uniref:Uncharacterized protein n=1 Tax=Massariosphaeria phaeospora TaxID=100035 RepID=A0A7C8I7L7_9PLEO|nr:hypothetical protein BDV95DRAFT_599059 [Massariosphaeria phaeospora]